MLLIDKLDSLITELSRADYCELETKSDFWFDLLEMLIVITEQFAQAQTIHVGPG